jgi:hypothetical protein
VFLWGIAVINGASAADTGDVPDSISVDPQRPVPLSCGSPELSSWEPPGRIPEPGPPSEHPMLQRMVAWCTKRVAELPGLFRTEPRDPEWADSMEQHLQAYLTGYSSATGIRIESVQCRRTVCSVESSLRNRAAVNSWSPLIANMQHEMLWKFWLASLHLRRSPDGWSTTVMLRRVAPTLQLFIDSPTSDERQQH